MKSWITVFVAVLLFCSSESYSQTADTAYYAHTFLDADNDELVIKIVHGNKNLSSIRIHDAIGKEVVFVDITPQKFHNTSSITINISSLKPGIYFCSIYSDKGLLETKRIYRAASH
ncbi:MAG: T9SS type A sorting domain-containing protein [Cytophagaceae bacterium]|nr:T9SS type A sorting domain-containing protein [Cytophagaceae bacterium]MDW8457214.1 T9SS type A sorting domain-containing protein [Cytophagaceae bacterium]